MSELNIIYTQNTQIRTQNEQSQVTGIKTTTAETSIFSSDNITANNQTDILTKEEKRAKQKLEKAEAKAERKRIANTPDGIIQGGKQGSSAGDCWLLAQMNSIAKTDWGKELYKKAITTNDDGSYTVHFEGVKKDITISEKEFKNAKSSSYYSSSDADALLLEIAVERHFKDTKLNNGTIYGNDLAGEDSLQYLMTGKKGRQTNRPEEIDIILKTMGQNSENNNNISAIYISRNYDHQGSSDMHHAVSVNKVILDEKGEINKVVLLDSYYPDSPKTVSYKTFKNELKLFGYTTTPQK